MTRHVLVATDNPAKVSELRRWVDGWAVRAVPVDAHRPGPEDGSSFSENAIAKAAELSARMPGEVVVATDGGLLVPGLGDAWDPLRTGRFAGAGASPADRARRLLRLAAELRGLDRAIGWQEALAVAVDGEHRASWVADSPPGELATSPHESLLGMDRGFWVAAVWRCPECAGKRLVDLTPDERSTRLDHWMQLGSTLSGWLSDRDERRAAMVPRP